MSRRRKQRGFFLIASTGAGRRRSTSGGGGGGGGGSPIVGDKYVSATGNNGNAGTKLSPYATIAFALTQITDNQIVVVLDNLTESINFSTITGGSASGYRTVAGETAVKNVTGTISGGSGGTAGTQKYLKFQNIQFLIGTSQADFSNVRQVKCVVCGFFGGPTTGNNSTHLAGTDQLYENCWFGGMGGRYGSLCFQRTNTLYRMCVVRTEDGIIDTQTGDPGGGIQIYSSTNCARLNCIAVDCLNPSTDGEWLAGLVVTTNVGAGTGIEDISCVTSDISVGAGIQYEGSDNVGTTTTDCVSVRNQYGAICFAKSSGTSTFVRGEYSSNSARGIANFGTGNAVLSGSPNCGSNSGGATSGTSGTSTTNAPNIPVRLAAMKMIGVPGTLRGDTNWNTAQSTDMFPFPNEDIIRAAYRGLAAGNATRGFCGNNGGGTPYTLSTYLQR